MDIRRKTLLALIITFIILFSIIAGVSVSLYDNQLGYLEQQEVTREVTEVISAISNEKDDLSNTLNDWSSWDDTYQFALDQNQDYITKNLDEKSLSAIRVNLFMVADNQGHITYGKMVDPVTGHESPLPQYFDQLLPSGHSFYNFSSIPGTNTGILLLPSGPMIVASSPALNNRMEGPPHGVLVMGRFLNDRELATISRVTGAPIFTRWNGDRISDNTQLSLLQEMNPDSAVVSIPRSDSIISGYTVINDINGQKILIVTDQPRDLYLNGHAIIQTYLVLFTLVILVTLFIVLLIIDRTILKRLYILTNRVRKFGQDNTGDIKPELTGNDEIAQLELAILTAHTNLKNSKDEFRAIFDLVNDGIHIHEIEPDGTPGKFIKVNKVACLMLQYTYDELLEHEPLDFVSGNHNRPLNEITGELLSTGHAVFETGYRRKDGSVIPVEINAQVVSLDGKRVVVSVVRDITERKKAQDALNETNEYLNNLFDYANAPIIVWNPEFIITRFNPAFEKLTLRSEQEVIGQPVDLLFTEESRETSIQQIKNTLEGKRWETVEIPILVKDGSVRTVLWNSANILDPDGRIVSTIAQGVDLTVRKQAQDALHTLTRELESRVLQRTSELEQEIVQRNAAEAMIKASLNEKEILLREIHHRVKNNLQIITSLIRLQRRQIDDQDIAHSLQDSENRIRSMALVHEKLYRSADLASIDFTEYTRSLSASLITAYITDTHRIHMIIDIRDVSLDINSAIPVGLIMNELVANALKHAFPDERSGEITITGRRTPAGIALSVQDNGVGIPEELDWRDTPTLGLQLVITLIEQVKGSIELDRSVGTAFEMFIPF